MKIKALLLFLFALLSIQNVNAGDEQKKLAVTVYNQNLGVIKDVRTFSIKNGESTISLTDVAQFIDPTSVHIKLEGAVLEQNYQYDLVSVDKILQKYIDKNVQLLGKNGELIEGKLLSSYGAQVVLQKNEGGLLMIPNINEYRFSVESLPEGLKTKPTLVWTVSSPKTGNQDVEVTYQTNGMNWHAEYVALLNKDDTALDLNSWVSVENQSGTTYKDAKLKLIAGDINMIQEQPTVYMNGLRRAKTMSIEADEQFAEKSFFEYHIYNLKRPTTLANNETKQISLFESNNVKAGKKFYYKSFNNYGGTIQGKVSVVVEFINSSDDGLGVPMPKGKVRVYKHDGESVEFVGEDLIDHTPIKEKVKLKIGDAFDIVVEDKQTENNKITDKVFEKVWEVTLKNRKKENVVVDVEKYLGSGWKVISSNFDFSEKDSQNIQIRVPVKADDETTLKLKVRFTN
ncbi:MAG: DUF4139 domain-containing protein [Ignavibacteriae bacterium HGW-Ignavibacteriae-2]|jgi:hypothetical protein|nr:DUF4139 domain-containing protein [Bacteroidota bacterium]PKL90025.1 MAG: DUF4139 domain-containing protein [Ignavibacteriae bacterium HGW-Ignavibacteriae-2]